MKATSIWEDAFIAAAKRTRPNKEVEAMKAYSLLIGACLIAALALSACDSGQPGSKAGTGTALPSPTAYPTSEQTPPVTPYLSPNLGGSATPQVADNEAPSYQEIQKEIQRIAAQAGISAKERSDQLQNYYTSLENKRVQGWKGWVLAAEPSEQDFLMIQNPSATFGFDLFVSMTHSNIHDSPPPYTEVGLNKVPLKQVEGLDVWHDPNRALDPSLQQISFDGAIAYVAPGGYVTIKDSSIVVLSKSP